MVSDKIELMFDGILKECRVEVDSNGELVCSTADGRFVKFPRGADLIDMAKAHNKANSTIPVYGPAGSSIPTRIPKTIKKATALDLDSGRSYLLTVRQDASCHFFDTFRCGAYDVQLRLDWSDMDAEGNPTLDADFILPGTTKIDKNMKTDPAHHTRREFDAVAKKYLYDFEYSGVHLRLIVEITVAQEITGVSRIEKAPQC